jgi:putative component of toxin-antitoxin plasmid stabilization module
LVRRIVGVGQAHGLHRAKAQGLAAAFGHDLDRQAAVEIARRLALLELGLFGGEQRVDEGLVLARFVIGQLR